MASIYIDPSASTNGSGSITSPFNAFPTVTANNDYFIKRNTRLVLSAAIDISTGDDNVTIDAYGTGSKPILDANNAVSANITVSGSGVSNVTVKNVVCIGATGTAYVVNIAGTADNVLFDGVDITGKQECLSVTSANCTNITIQNCKLYSGEMNNQCLEFNSNGAGCEAINNTITYTGTNRNQTSLIGIYVLSGAAVTLTGNTIIGFYNGIELRTDGSTASDNTISFCYNAGVSIRDADSCVVEDNILTDIWNGLQYDGGAGAGLGGGLGAGVLIVDVADAALSNIVRRNRITNCYQGILDQSDFGGANQFYDNLIVGHRVNGISYQSDGAIGKIWNNTIIHHPQDTVTPTGHGIVVQSGTTTTRASIRNNIIICDLLSSNVQCLSLGGTPGTNFVEIELQNNIYSTSNGAHLCALSSVNYDTLATWQSAISAVTQITVKDSKSRAVNPQLNSKYQPWSVYTVGRGDTPLGTTDVYGVTRRTIYGTIGAVEPSERLRPAVI